MALDANTVRTSSPDEPEEKENVKSASAERRIVQRLMRTSLARGDEWYVLSYKWWQLWCEYAQFNEAPAERPRRGESQSPGSDSSDDAGMRPPPIDNSDLANEDYKLALRLGLQESRDFTLVHSSVWIKLLKWYGGGPEFNRRVITQGYALTPKVDLYPFFIRVCWTDENGEPGDAIEDLSIGREKSFQDVLDNIIKEQVSESGKKAEFRVWYLAAPKPNPGTSIAPTPTENHSAMNGVVHTGEVATSHSAGSQSDTGEGMQDEEPRSPSVDNMKDVDDGEMANGTGKVPLTDQKTWRVMQDDNLLRPIQEWDVPQGDLFILEKRTDRLNPWSRNAVKQDYMDFQIGDVLDVESASWDECVPIAETHRFARQGTNTDGPHKSTKRANTSYSGSGRFSYNDSEQGAPIERGAVGLRNLGNTCFMNSTLQCLSNTPLLTHYFLSGRFRDEINKDNPLGRGGRIASAWGNVIEDLWSGKYRSIAPRALKTEIGAFAPRFMGYQQQDSSELLAFLVDGLHEDLNRIVEKPYVDSVESDGRPDAEVALESWDAHIKRNDSIVVDTMQGQLKSTVVCPDCGLVSITFDPYMILTVPFPAIRNVVKKVTLVYADRKRNPKVFGPKVEKYGTIGSLKTALSELSGVRDSHMVVCEIWRSKFQKIFHDDSRNSELRNGDDIYVFEVPPPMVDGVELPREKYAVCELINSHASRQSYSYSLSTYLDEFGLPLLISVPTKTTGKNVLSIVREALSEFLLLDDEKVPETSTKNPSQNGVGPSLDSKSSEQMSNGISHMELDHEQSSASLSSSPTSPLSSDTDEKVAESDESDGSPYTVRLQESYSSAKPILDDDTEMEFKRKHRTKFSIVWKSRKCYDTDFAKDPDRDPSAPKSTYDRGYGSPESQPIPLSDCINEFTRTETLNHENEWYCRRCKDHKCAQKKFDLWSSPDILVIVLKRFTYTHTYRDRINTLVEFPIEGLDIRPWIVNNDHQDTVYDLYAVSNHMGGMGGGHYTAYAQNLIDGKWYILDDSHVSPLDDTQRCVSSSAYVLYYKRRGVDERVRGVPEVVMKDTDEDSSRPAVRAI
eukprot:473702_1